MKVKRTIYAFVAGVFCLLSTIFPSLNASAVDSEITITNGSTTDGNTTVLIRRKIKNISIGTEVYNYFSYDVVADPNNPAGAYNEPTSAQVVFDGVEAEIDDEGYYGTSVAAIATDVVDFVGTTYTQPGDYIYTLTETYTDDENYAIDTGTSYRLFVSVRNKMESLDGVEYTEGELEATVLSYVEDVSTGEKVEEALFGAQEAEHVMFHINTGVGGNAGDLDHCFKYKLEVFAEGGLTAGDELDINYDEAGTELCDETEDTVTVGTPAYIYLKHHQQAFIGQDTGTGMLQIPLGAKYRVTNEGDDDYAVTAGVSYGGMGEYIEFEEGQPRATGIITVSIATTDQGVSFSHTKTLAALTGVSIKSLPYIIAGAISAFGILIVTKNIAKKSSRRA